MSFDDIENNLSGIERHSETYEEEKGELEARENALNKALDKVDATLAKALEKNTENLRKDRRKLERAVKKCQKDLDEAIEKLAEIQEETKKSEQVIHNLEKWGLDISESEGILQYRRQIIQKCSERIQALAERLDMLGVQSETQENIGQTTKASETLSSREKFLESIHASVAELPPKKTGSSSSNWGDPNIGSQIKDIKTETSMEIGD